MSNKKDNDDFKMMEKEEFYISNICDKQISISSSEDEEEDNGVLTLTELTNEIHQIQIDDTKKNFFDDFDELFESQSMCFDVNNQRVKLTKKEEEELERVLKGKQKKESKPSFNDISIIQTVKEKNMKKKNN